jgi:hypothetical protein
VAGVYQGFTKNTNEGNNPVYDDATFWILLLETLSWVGLFLIKEKNFVLLLTNSITKK